MLSSSGRNLATCLGIAIWTCLKSVGAPMRGLRGPLYAFNFLLTEKLPRLDARETKLLVLVTHSLDDALVEDGASCGSGRGGGIRRGCWSWRIVIGFSMPAKIRKEDQTSEKTHTTDWLALIFEPWCTTAKSGAQPCDIGLIEISAQQIHGHAERMADPHNSNQQIDGKKERREENRRGE